MLNGDSGPAVARPGLDAEGKERAPEGGRLDLDGAWQDVSRQREIAREREEELARKREDSKRRKQAEEAAAWTDFVRSERREIELRREGQLAELLGAPLPGELPELLKKLAAHDQIQAQRGLVALMSGGNTTYKPLEDLRPEDMPARIAANRLRTTWLKERRDQWLGRGETPA